MAKGKGEIKGWITKNGVHIPIYGHYSVRGGEEPKAKGSKFKGKKKPDKYTNPRTGKRDHVQGRTQADLNQALKEQGLELDGAYQRAENEEKVYMYDKDGNVYSGTFNKYSDGGREIVNIEKDTLNGESNVRNLDPDRDEHIRKGESKGAKREEAIKKQVNERFKTAKELKAEGKWDTSEEEKQARQSFRDKKAQEQGFADDASMRSYNEETGVNKETWKGQESSKSEFGKQTNDDISNYRQKFLSNRSDQELKELQTNLNKKVPGVPTSPSDMVASAAVEQELASRRQESSNTAYNYNGQTITHHPNGVKPAFHGNEEYNYEVHPAKGEKGANQYFKTEQEAQDYINGRNTKSQASSTQSFSPESSAKAINDMARRRANGGGKDDDWKIANQTLESAPAGTTMIQTGDRGVKFQYTKGEDGKWHSSAGEDYTQDSKTLSMSWRYSSPSVEFTTSDKALSNEDIKASHDAATSGRLNQALGLDRNNRPIGNRSTRKVDTSTSTRTEKQDSLSASMNERSRIRGEFHVKDKAMKAAMPTTVSGLRSAYADATGSMKSKIAAELRRKGYSLVGGKWVKGK